MPAIAPGTALHTFVDTFRQAISDVCSQALGSAWSVAIDDDAAGAPGDSSLSFQFVISAGLQGTVAVEIRTPDLLLLAQKFLAEASDPLAALRQDHKEALEELLRQIAGVVATGLKGKWGETKIDVQACDPPAWEGITLTLRASEAAGSLPLRLRLSSELLASLSSSPSAVAQAPAKTEQSPTADDRNEPNFDLLLGVDLNLTLRFGQCVMSLRDLLDLNSGSVIELDREVTEPADLLLGDKLVARGEVVIVDGNYGIRITEVTDPRQRLSTL
jgi:flagellar motor switch protein FliN/FliY